MAFPASMALPPPIEITARHSSWRACSRPAHTVSMDGSPAVAKVEWDMFATSGSTRSGWAPVTTSARPHPSAAFGSWRDSPSPNTIRAAVANSKGIVGGKDAAVYGAGAWRRQHFGNALRPLVVVRGLAVRGMRGGIAIGLEQLEVTGVAVS